LGISANTSSRCSRGDLGRDSAASRSVVSRWSREEERAGVRDGRDGEREGWREGGMEGGRMRKRENEEEEGE
jgi:hypothetical protein